jgi:type VI secretion system protein ImpM
LIAQEGFYGKLPTRGDFVCAGVPRDFRDPWDAWLERVMPAAHARLGDAWEAAWAAAPAWRFVLPPHACGRDAALGVWLASADRVGRRFPLVVLRLARAQAALLADGAAFLQAAERASTAAIAEGLSPVDLAVRPVAAAPAAELPAFPPGIALWWTGATEMALPGLPDEADFVAMLQPRTEVPP